jgi:hypothetical protein
MVFCTRKPWFLWGTFRRHAENQQLDILDRLSSILLEALEAKAGKSYNHTQRE